MYIGLEVSEVAVFSLGMGIAFVFVEEIEMILYSNQNWRFVVGPEITYLTLLPVFSASCWVESSRAAVKAPCLSDTRASCEIAAMSWG